MPLTVRLVGSGRKKGSELMSASAGHQLDKHSLRGCSRRRDENNAVTRWIDWVGKEAAEAELG